MGRRLQVDSLNLPIAAVKLDGVQSGRIEWPIWSIWLLAYKRPDSGPQMLHTVPGSLTPPGEAGSYSLRAPPGCNAGQGFSLPYLVNALSTPAPTASHLPSPS